MTNPADIRELLIRFTDPDLTQTRTRIESAVRGDRQNAFYANLVARMNA